MVFEPPLSLDWKFSIMIFVSLHHRALLNGEMKRYKSTVSVRVVNKIMLNLMKIMHVLSLGHTFLLKDFLDKVCPSIIKFILAGRCCSLQDFIQ